MDIKLRYFVLCVLVLASTANGFLLDTITNHLPHTVCYGDLGCFNNGIPFLDLLHRPLSVAPESPSKIQTRFLLYTRANPTMSQEQLIDPHSDTSIEGSNFDGTKPTKIIVHGFTHNAHRNWILNMTKELLTAGDFNVITVDWHKGAVLPYEQATANTRVVGAQVAQIVHKLIQMTGSTSAMFHIIGHSLGAHVAGYAGERISHLARISGLDPASPYFENMDIKVRLDPSDADFVDVIHTDGGGVKNIGFGASQEMGHVDFYPNGGERQPGCASDAVDKLGATTWTAVTSLFNYYAEEEALACSHERSYYYFTESINSPCPFTAFVCPSADDFHKGHCVRCRNNGCSSMGYHADKFDARGKLYLETESHPTFCDYVYQLNISTINNFDGILTATLVGSNGTVGPQPLMSANELHLRNEIISKIFWSRTDVGDVQSLTLRYEKINTVVISGSYPDDWQVLGISVWKADTQKRNSFCAYHKEIDNHKSATFGLSGTC
ncbi:inactive pancreatic lipase-related protein 1-like [Mercenaria mercenaria]|uniref:inactive pancreatic lipase-related protein 1-like n=1 Tax=Mercenaria mercenaria TaxID=6596 RepID=UPI001E1DF63F|nr:inactive pancreatic lipase-related protein 1-like [Mercenaria mercenaria]